LGNQIFNRLKVLYLEPEESRMLFLYSITQKTIWNIINSNHWILIEPNGVSKNFKDTEIELLNKQWLDLKQQVDYQRLISSLQKMRAEYDRPAPKDGDIWEMGGSSIPTRNIDFQF